MKQRPSRTFIVAGVVVGLSLFVILAMLFYGPTDKTLEETMAPITRMGVLAVEMEAAGLYGLAIERGAAALAVCSVSDDLTSGGALTPDERETSLSDMVTIVLDSVV